jgi:hypothetical protein
MEGLAYKLLSVGIFDIGCEESEIIVGKSYSRKKSPALTTFIRIGLIISAFCFNIPISLVFLVVLSLLSFILLFAPLRVVALTPNRSLTLLVPLGK